MILVTGGCRSGKSEFAEKLAAQGAGGRRLYIATARITDHEMQARVLRHQKRRGAGWDTFEAVDSAADGGLDRYLSGEDIQGYDGILLDSVTTLVTGLLFDFIGEKDWESFDFSSVDYGAASRGILRQIRQIADAARKLPMVFVTDEIGLGVVPDTCLGRNFRDILGEVNQYLAGVCDQVYVVISGIPVKIKDGVSQ